MVYLYTEEGRSAEEPVAEDGHMWVAQRPQFNGNRVRECVRCARLQAIVPWIVRDAWGRVVDRDRPFDFYWETLDPGNGNCR